MDGRIHILGSPGSTIEVSDPPPFRAEMRRVLRLASPIIATRVSHLALGFTDFVMVSWLGTEATAAASPATLSIWIVLCLGMGLVSAVQTFAAQAMGRRQPHHASAYTWAGIWLAALYALAAAPLHLGVQPFWQWVGHAPAVQTAEAAYCGVALWCVGPAVVCSALESFFNGIQKPGVVLRSVVVAILFNAVGDYVLIFGKLGFPAMGIAGAAVATVLAWTIRVGMLLAAFLSPEYARAYGARSQGRPDWLRMLGIIRLGVPTGLQWLLDVGSWFLFLVWLMAGFGTAALAASNITLQFMHVSFMPALGIGTAVCSLVGHSVGQRDWNLARRQTLAALVLCSAYMGSVGLLYAVGRGSLIRLLSADPGVVRVGAGILVWAAVFQLFDAVGITYMNALRGAGDTRYPAIVVVLHCWVIFVLGGWLMTRIVPEWGYHGPWMTCTLYIILLGVMLWRRWAGGSWQRIRLFKENSDAPGLTTVDSASPAAAILEGAVLPEPAAAAEARP